VIRGGRTLLLASLALSLVAGPSTAARRGTPLHYRFSFTLAAKPDYRKNYPEVRISGSGSGSFSIYHRQIDRDGTVFWDVTDARGGFTLRVNSRVIVRAVIVGGHYSPEKAAGSLLRGVLFKLRLTEPGRFRCPSPAAQLGLQDLPQTNGNLDGMDFHACTTDLQWDGAAPALVVNVIPG
jgi:hypothetical protein